MKSNLRVPGGRPLLTTRYKYNYSKVLGFISDEGGGSNELGDPYISCFPDIYSDAYVRPVVCPHLLVSYFNACNAIDNHNRIRKPYLVLEKYVNIPTIPVAQTRAPFVW